MTPHHLIVIPAQAGIQFCTGCTYALEHRDVREGRVQDVLHEMCSRHFLSAYIPVGDAANDYMDVGGRATPGAVAEHKDVRERPVLPSAMTLITGYPVKLGMTDGADRTHHPVILYRMYLCREAQGRARAAHHERSEESKEPLNNSRMDLSELP